ncbi:unnamed protein product [Lactuca saligna]|uniref:Uncharacterized protein n=1 Tax=Lactuca saligna TaxID=75948 RepID=A0AA36DZ17_LACSI|nr:unnamed protein product [Lactuca saligna]
MIFIPPPQIHSFNILLQSSLPQKSINLPFLFSTFFVFLSPGLNQIPTSSISLPEDANLPSACSNPNTSIDYHLKKEAKKKEKKKEHKTTKASLSIHATFGGLETTIPPQDQLRVIDTTNCCSRRPRTTLPFSLHTSPLQQEAASLLLPFIPSWRFHWLLTSRCNLRWKSRRESWVYEVGQEMLKQLLIFIIGCLILRTRKSFRSRVLEFKIYDPE